MPDLRDRDPFYSICMGLSDEGQLWARMQRPQEQSAVNRLSYYVDEADTDDEDVVQTHPDDLSAQNFIQWLTRNEEVLDDMTNSIQARQLGGTSVSRVSQTAHDGTGYSGRQRRPFFNLPERPSLESHTVADDTAADVPSLPSSETSLHGLPTLKEETISTQELALPATERRLQSPSAYTLTEQPSWLDRLSVGIRSTWQSLRRCLNRRNNSTDTLNIPSIQTNTRRSNSPVISRALQSPKLIKQSSAAGQPLRRGQDVSIK